MNLDVIDVAEPCTVDWNSMHGNERTRRCDLCEKNVYDLSTLSRSDAEALIESHEGRLCVRFYRRADGTVQTADCQPIRQRLAAAARRTRQRLAIACGAMFAMAGLSAMAVRLSRASTPEMPGHPEIVSGGVALPSTRPVEPPVVNRTMGIIAEPPATRPTNTFIGEIAPPPRTPVKKVIKPHVPATRRK